MGVFTLLFFVLLTASALQRCAVFFKIIIDAFLCLCSAQ